jgi:hypothetical protein
MELIDTGVRVLVLALLAGASPMAMVATVAVLTSGRGRTNGIAYGVGFTIGQAFAFAIALFVGSAASDEAPSTAAEVLELVLGVAMLAAAWLQRRPRPPKPVGGPSRSKALLARLQGLRPRTAFVVGGLLGIGGIKRLSITLIAGAAVGAADLLRIEKLGLGLLYILVSGALVSVPVVTYVIAGARADAWMASAKDWVAARERQLAVVTTAVFGVVLTVDALVRLIT